jgi:hypothetical protein
MNIVDIIKEELIKENLQLADKVYFNTGLLSNEDKENILKITNGDHYTKIISDIYYYNKEYNNFRLNDKEIFFKNDFGKITIKEMYDELKNYNKNILPLVNYNIYTLPKNEIYSFISYLINRKVVLNFLKKIPSTSVRNIRNEIRLERNYIEFNKFTNLINYLNGLISQLDNKDEKLKNKILNKAFKSNNKINDIINFFEDKENLIGSNKVKKSDIIKIIDESYQSIIVYNKNNYLIVEISNPNDLKKIGCNSLWCFTYGENNWKVFNNYSYNGLVYVIFDFGYETDVEGFSYTIIKPPKMFEDVESEYFDDEEEYDEQNVYMFNHFNDPINLNEANMILQNIFGNMELAYETINFE